MKSYNIDKELLKEIKVNKEDYGFSYWGPFLFKTYIDERVTQLIYKQGLECKKKANYMLAGQIKNEFQYSQKILKNIYTYLNCYFEYYFEAHSKHYNRRSKIKKIKPIDLWINFQGKNEYNPSHIHGGTHSFVLYCSVPEQIKKECEEASHKTTFAHPGGIMFSYGEGSKSEWSALTNASFFPQKNLIFIFPSTLRHQVFPFKCDAVRVSVSGNITVS